MESIRVLVRDAARSIQGTVAREWAESILGAISADPETLDELDQALQRFQIEAPLSEWRETFEESDADPDDEPCYVILDLPSRLIFSNAPGFAWEEAMSAPVFQEGRPVGVELLYQLPKSWDVFDGLEGWRERVARLRRQRELRPPADDRHVLYDELPNWMAEAVYGARLAGHDDPTIEIHVGWLSTPRGDLQGRTPRDVLVAALDEIERDVGWRRTEWSRLGRPPIPLPRGSRAYREGGIGLHEFILYYDMFRHLLGRAWQRLDEQLCDVDTLAACIRTEMRHWLNPPVEEGRSRSFVPAEAIDLERQRIPLTASPEEAMIDCDCPLCQMMAEENFGPTFVQFDTCHFDLGFVFSPYRNRDEWESENEAMASVLDRIFRDEREQAESSSDGAEMRGANDAPSDRSAARGAAATDATDQFGEPGVFEGDDERESLDDDFRNQPAPPSLQRLVQALAGMGARTSAAFVAKDSDAGLPPSGGLWRKSLIAPTPATADREERLQSQLFEVAAHSAELRDSLQSERQQFERLELVIEEFANLRAAMRERDEARVHRLADRCVAELNQVGVSTPHVAEQCADLERAFRRLEQTICERPAELTRRRRRRRRRRRAR